MIETIIVIVIVGLAIFFAARRIYTTIASKNRKSANCGDCSSNSCSQSECD